jgi:hypothetical protein
MAATQELTTLRFAGARFEDGGLEIDVLPELVAYKKLLVETAKELWRQRNPERERLPKGFETAISIKFFELQPGSTVVPLRRQVADGLLPDIIVDELDDAADLIEAGIDAVSRDQRLPDGFPKRVIPLFGELGATLAADEAICAKARRRSAEARYTHRVRERLVNWLEPTYEDLVNVVGEIRAADLDGRNFVLRLDDGRKVPGKFEVHQEALITDALRDHATRRLRIKGLGEFVRDGGGLKRIVRVDEVKALAVGEPEYDPTAKPIWQIALELGATVPDEEWAKVPPDLSVNLDHYLYGVPKKDK